MSSARRSHSPSDRRPLEVGRDIVAILADLYGENTPDVVIQAVEHSMHMATVRGERGYRAAFDAESQLLETLGPEAADGKIFQLRCLLRELGAHLHHREYLQLARTSGYAPEPAPILPDVLPYVSLTDAVLFEITVGPPVAAPFVGASYLQFCTELERFRYQTTFERHEKALAGFWWEMRGLVSELACFRASRSDLYIGSTDAWTDDRAWRARAVRDYSNAARLYREAGNNANHRVSQRMPGGNLHPYDWAADVVDTERFSPDLRRALALALTHRTLSLGRRSASRNSLTKADLLLGLYRGPCDKTRGILSGLGVRDQLTVCDGVTKVDRTVREVLSEPVETLSLDGVTLRSTLAKATRIAGDRGDKIVDCEHLLMALVSDATETTATRVLSRLNAPPAQVKQRILTTFPSRPQPGVALPG